MVEFKKKKEKILYIDDEVEACKTIVEFFGLRGFEVLVSFDGNNGYTLITQEKPSVIIMDLKIAGMSGIDLLEKLLGERMRIPVVVVTAYQEAMAEIKERGLAVNRYFTKPYDLKSLYEAVNELIG